MKIYLIIAVVVLLVMQFMNFCRVIRIPDSEGKGAVMEIRQCKSPLQALFFGV